ncbi:MAG: class I SAM-dependent methyltransferase [Chloroflexota bacterium]
MPVPVEYSFRRYLAAKKSVDDRALNRGVWDTLRRMLVESGGSSPLRVLEVGAGIGTMIERMLAWNLLPGDALITAVDVDPDLISEARERLPQWGAEAGFEVSPGLEETIILREPARQVTIWLEAADIRQFVRREGQQRRWDLLLAHAFLDLVDVPKALPALLALLHPGGHFAFTITYDGLTILEPAIDPAIDAQVMALYDRTMDERQVDSQPSGDSQAGRHLYGNLRRTRAEVLAAGASDWVVFPGPGGYPADEAYFLHYIVHTIHNALRGHPDLDAARFAGWIAERHAQVEREELVYIAHQVDILGRVPPS